MAEGFDREVLRNALLARYPWLRLDEVGPRSVDAGECDRCGNEPRLVSTCGPAGFEALGRRCARELGFDAWCDGHEADARVALAWLEDLPPEADDVARLWWVSTGEVRLDAMSMERAGLAETLALTLAPGEDDE